MGKVMNFNFYPQISYGAERFSPQICRSPDTPTRFQIQDRLSVFMVLPSTFSFPQSRLFQKRLIANFSCKAQAPPAPRSPAGDAGAAAPSLPARSPAPSRPG